MGSDFRAKEQMKNYIKHNLPDQLTAANASEEAVATQRVTPAMSVMTAA